MQPASLGDALAGLAALKDEHRPLVAQIARDAGMSPQTREMLLLHLNEEEEERIGQAVALLGGGAGASAGAGSLDRAPRLTVGSLREQPGGEALQPLAPGATVGCLRI